MEERRHVILNLTEEQYMAVKHFLDFHDWNFDRIATVNEWANTDEHPGHSGIDDNGSVTQYNPTIDDGDKAVENTTKSSSFNNTADICGSTTLSCAGISDGSSPNCSGRVEIGQEIIDKDERECPFCFLTPCVSIPKQSWLGEKIRPNTRNTGLRKQRYRKFWKLLSTRGAWLDERYQQKKNKLYKSQDSRQGTVWTLREVMPDCILSLVRSLFPNPIGMPYMGHKWE